MLVEVNIIWLPEDILALRPDWTEEQATKWLKQNQKQLRDRMTEDGWERIESMLPKNTD